MADLIELLGGKLLGKDGEVDTETVLKSKTAIALYFSAHWCPPCRGFTPQFAEWYKNDLQSKGLEVIFVSSDRDDEAFKEYYGDMPWLALPYSERERKETLSKKFKVNGIPSVVILGPDGKLITADGRAAISSDPKGEEIPWKPKTFKEVFDDAVLCCPGDTKKKGSDLAGKVLGLYFSAHWCPPCRGFTPKLAEWYSASLKEKGFEVVFVSSDKDQETFNSYFGEQPWLALDFSDRKRKEQLSQLFGVEGIPSLVIVDKDGSVITKDGRGAITADTTGKEFPWYPKPVSNLNRGPGDINEVTTVVAFCETSDQATQQAIEQAMEPLAKKMKTEAKAQGDDNPRVAFLIVTENSGLAPKVREMLSLPTLPPSKHENSIEDKEGGETFQAKLMIVDIPDEGAYYEGPEGDVTAETVQTLVDNYLAKSLERKQLE
jgi:nucleoredoxin